MSWERKTSRMRELETSRETEGTFLDRDKNREWRILKKNKEKF